MSRSKPKWKPDEDNILKQGWDGYWDQQDVSFVRRRDQYPGGGYPFAKDPHFPMVQRALAGLNGTRVILDAGCGSGQWVFYSGAKGHRAFGLDISSKAITKATALGRQQDLSCGFVLGDVRHMPFPSGMFDYVFSFGVVEHFSDTISALRESHRILRPGGRCLVTVPNIYSMKLISNFILKTLGKLPFEREDLYSPSKLSCGMQKAGFVDRGHGVLPSGYMLGSSPLLLPIIGDWLFGVFYRTSYFIESRQSRLGFLSYCIGEKIA
ncbi:MAG: class I SAM-dependent methyltransferase [Chloroflexi bacterium]|nr:class I SAM-dependent methyltransferase [Chloroflexota bacterium]